ncbi:hypothetical protein L3Q82_019086, partial [Scortum barcoo]
NPAITDDEGSEEEDDDMMDPDFIPPTCNLDAPNPSDESSSAKRRYMLPAVEVLTLMKTMTPLHYFCRYFSPQVIKHITSDQPLATQKDINTTFTPTEEEMMNFVAILMYMGIIQLPSVDNYWEMETRVLQVANLMSSKRFRLLKRLVHFNDNTNIPGTNHRFFKIWPLLSFLNTAFRRKDYTGGPWCPLTPEQEAMGATIQIVSILANTMSSSTTTAIFADNFFSSLEVVRYLKDKNCRYTGTAGDNQIVKPPLKSIKEMEKKAVPRGTCNCVLSDDRILSVNGKQGCHCPLTVQPASSLSRYCSDTKRKEDVICPALIKSYKIQKFKFIYLKPKITNILFALEGFTICTLTKVTSCSISNVPP